MHTTKHSRFSISWPILPPPSQAKVDCGVFEVYKQADPLKWAACLPIGHALPTPKASIFSPIFCCHKQSRLSVPRLIRRPKRYPMVEVCSGPVGGMLFLLRGDVNVNYLLPNVKCNIQIKPGHQLRVTYKKYLHQQFSISYKKYLLMSLGILPLFSKDVVWVKSILLCRNHYYTPHPAFVLKGVSQSSYAGTTTFHLLVKTTTL
jgi:hypothetical protein